MVTMDAKMGIQLVRLIHPDVTIPIHYDDYGARRRAPLRAHGLNRRPADVFLSPLQDFKDEMTKAGLDPNVVYLGRGEAYSFAVRE
jgi:L-ascorbate metabolism protein UlaG (beta-lactamase superfamily)